MRLIIENKIDIIPLGKYAHNYLKKMNVWMDGDLTFILEQKIDLPDKQLTKVMQIIEEHSVEPLIIRWFPDPKFYMYTEEYYFKIYGEKNV